MITQDQATEIKMAMVVSDIGQKLDNRSDPKKWDTDGDGISDGWRYPCWDSFR